jgi:aspartate/methionine/tyrosine aminotransferase
MLGMSQRVAGFGTTVFVEINNLARRHNAVNLGQGAPDFDGPPEVLAAAVEAVNGALNQYAPGIGLPAVRQAIANHAALLRPEVKSGDRSVRHRRRHRRHFRGDPWCHRSRR